MCTFKININIDINYEKLETTNKKKKKNDRIQDIYIKNINDVIILIEMNH